MGMGQRQLYGDGRRIPPGRVLVGLEDVRGVDAYDAAVLADRHPIHIARGAAADMQSHLNLREPHT